MDQFTAHLDRGWDLVQKGDSRGASASARRALELDSQSPDAYNLLGYVCAVDGEFEEAVEHYRHAIALDDTYMEAMLNIAELYIHPLGEFERALEICNQALDLAETDEERIDALLLKFDAHLGNRDRAQAEEVCRHLPDGPFENPNHAFLVGRALFEMGDLSRSAPLIEEAVRSNARNSEVRYYLGLIRDEEGDLPGAVRELLASRLLDLELPVPSWSLSPEAFAMSVQGAIASLPSRLRAVIDPDNVFAAEMPGVEVVVDGVDPRALLVIDAMDEDTGDSTVRLFVYQRNVERLAGAVDLVESEIFSALERELTIFLGDDDVDPEIGGANSSGSSMLN